MKVKEPSQVDLNRHWLASLPLINNTLNEILEQLKILNENNKRSD